MKVLLLTTPMPSAPFRDAIAQADARIECIDWTPDLEDAVLRGIEVVLGWRLPAGLAPRLPSLRWVCAIAAGVEKLLVADLPPRVVVSRIVDGQQAAGIAQFVVAVALAHARDLARYRMQQQARDWTRSPLPIASHRAVVLGTGAMGGAIVDWLGRVGFRASGWNRRSGRSLHEVLAENDIAVCALPLTAETEGILDAPAFAAMPSGGYLINVARGAHIVEAALIEAVRSGHLAGAALDVQRREPMLADDPLWATAGITITPHIAAQSSPEVIAEQFAAAARAFQRGDAVPNAIDRSRGY